METEMANAILSKTNQILSGRPHIEVVKKDGGIGCTDGRVIQLNYDRMDDNWVLVKGVNYHELAHVLYTSRTVLSRLSDRNDPMSRYSGLFQFHNAIEDGRIETLFSARFPNIRGYFTQTLEHFLMNDGAGGVSESASYTTDRKMLYCRLRTSVYARKETEALRNKLRNMFKENMTDVDKYLDTFVSGNIHTRSDCTEWLYKNFILTNAQRTEGLNSRDQLVQRELENAADTANTMEEVKENKQLAGKVSEQISELNKKENVINVPAKTLSELKAELVKELNDAVSNDTYIQEDVKNDMKALGSQQDIGEARDIELTTQLLNEARHVKVVMSKLQGSLDTRAKMNMTSGKLCMKSAMQASRNGSCNVFTKKSTICADKLKARYSILLDTSGSIKDDTYDEEAKMGYCITKALEELGNEVEIIQFDSNATRTKRHDRKSVSWKRQHSGGTNLHCALNHITPTNKGQNHYVFVLTDGQFDSGYELRLNRTRTHAKVFLIKVGYDSIAADTKKQFDRVSFVKDFTGAKVIITDIVRDIQLDQIDKMKRGW